MGILFNKVKIVPNSHVTPTPTPSVTPTVTPTNSATPTITPTTTVSYSNINLIDCCTQTIKKSISVPTVNLTDIISNRRAYVINECCFYAESVGGDGSDGIRNGFDYKGCDDCVSILPCSEWSISAVDCCDESITLTEKFKIACVDSTIKPSTLFGGIFTFNGT